MAPRIRGLLASDDAGQDRERPLLACPPSLRARGKHRAALPRRLGQRIALTRLGPSDDEWGSDPANPAGTWQGLITDKHGEVQPAYDAVDWMLRGLGQLVPPSLSVDPGCARPGTARNGAAPPSRRSCGRRLNGRLTMAIPRRRTLPQGQPSRAICRRYSALIRQRTAAPCGGRPMARMPQETTSTTFLRIGTVSGTPRTKQPARILDVEILMLLSAQRTDRAVGLRSRQHAVGIDPACRCRPAAGISPWSHGNRIRPRDIVRFLILDAGCRGRLIFCCGQDATRTCATSWQDLREQSLFLRDGREAGQFHRGTGLSTRSSTRACTNYIQGLRLGSISQLGRPDRDRLPLLRVAHCACRSSHTDPLRVFRRAGDARASATAALPRSRPASRP